MNPERSPRKRTVAMLLANPYSPDDRVRQEAVSLQQHGYEVTILAWDRDCKKPEHETTDGVQIRRAHIRAEYARGERQVFRFLHLWKWYWRQLKALCPDVLHCHDLDTLLPGVLYRAMNPAVRLVFDAHECYYAMKRGYVMLPLAWAIRLVELLLTPQAHLLIAPCEATGDYYRRSGAHQLAVVGNWKRPADFEFSETELQRKRNALGIGNRLVVVYIGNLSPNRIVLPLVEAVRQRPGVFLILGGAGGQEVEIRRATDGLSNVYYPGYVHPDAVPLMTALAEVVYYAFDPVHPLAPYNAPNKLYEALAAGKALIAADLGGELSGVVRQVGSGVLLERLDAVSIGEALDKMTEPDVLGIYQMRAREAARSSYNWAACERNLLSAYAGLFPADSH